MPASSHKGKRDRIVSDDTNVEQLETLGASAKVSLSHSLTMS